MGRGRTFVKSYGWTAAVLVVLLGGWWLASARHHAEAVEDVRARVGRDLAHDADSLTAVLDARFALLRGLVAYLETLPPDEELGGTFPRFAATLAGGFRGIRNFAVAPGGVNRYVYPAPGNEGVVGHDLLRDPRPRVRRDVARAVTTRRLTVSGPYELRQGGLGLVARVAVFRDGRFWGLATMALDLPPLLEAAGLTAGSADPSLALRDRTGDVFYGRPEVFGAAPLVAKIPLPEGEWELAAVPAGGWEGTVAHADRGFRIAGLLIVALAAALCHLIVHRQSALAEAVRRRTETIAAVNDALRREAGERQEALGALRESETRYRLLFERNPHPMWVYDQETLSFLAVNEAAVRQYGYTPDEFSAMTAEDIRPEEDRAAFRQSVALAPEGLKEPGIWRHRRKDGSLLRAQITSQNLTFEGRPARLVLAHDVTERLALEERVRQGQRLEAVGRLAGGIAHDFNNLLTVITGCTELALRDRTAAHPEDQPLREILNAAERAAALTRQLLAFSRKQILAPEVLDLNRVLDDMGSMLRRVLGEDIRIDTVLAPDLGRVRADPGQVEQVILNLAINARDAMPHGGRLTLETANATLDEAYVGAHPEAAAGPHVLLAVSDTGVGMTPEVCSRVFEPFFTTKAPGGGTGLGLATVYGIVKQSGGSIAAYSEPDRGTTFRVYLPRVEVPAETRAKRPAPAGLPAGTETVLLVEDDPSVRSVTVASLGRLGYSVLEAGSADEAVRLAREHPGPIDLLVTDVVMPEVGGREVAERVAALRPGIRVLYVSGYTENAIVHQGILDPGVALLPKPFSLKGLALRVREVLDEVG